MNDLFLRVSDAAIGLFWLWQLVRTLQTGRICGQQSWDHARSERPKVFWFVVALFALMVVHFIGLAITGQIRPA